MNLEYHGSKWKMDRGEKKKGKNKSIRNVTSEDENWTSLNKCYQTKKFKKCYMNF